LKAGVATSSPFDGGQHRDGRRNDAVAVEQRRAEQPQQHQRARLSGIARVALHQRDQRHDAAFAIVIGAHDEGGVFHRHHQHQGPEDQRQDAEDVVRRDGHWMVRPAEHFLDGIQRAGADIAVHHAEGSQGQDGQACVVGS